MFMKKQGESRKMTSKSLKTGNEKKKTTKTKKESTKTIEQITKPAQRGNMKEIVSLRDMIRRSRPRFLRMESWRYLRVKDSWRKPRGIDNHMRREKKGWPKIVKIGYRGPVHSRGLHPTGFRDVLVHNVGELSGLNPEKDAVRLGSSLGGRKRLEVAIKAKEIGLKILNPPVLSRGTSER